MPVKPHYQIAIAEGGEPLVAIPTVCSLVLPHPYAALGAPYGETSPFYVRQSVGDRLLLAHQVLQQHTPGWRIQIFDAYRSIAVQQFMVDYTLRQLAIAAGLPPEALTESQRESLLQQVYEFWAPPSPDPMTPPPHSTGGAIDVTLINQNHQPVDMGSPIDEVSPRSYPDHFASSADPQAASYHRHRLLLRQVMEQAGFQQHPHEWWHFCYGDQMWAWLTNGRQVSGREIARYGGI